MENTPFDADDQSVGAPYMSGLYRRALEIYRQTVGLRLVGKGEKGLDIEDVSPEDRKKILRQINEVIDRNRIQVDADTFAITAKRSGIGLPILINASVVLVVVAALLAFTFLFNRQEDVLAAGTGTILSAESKLIETLRKESQAQLQEKDREILAFQEQLQDTLAQQRRLEAETERTLREREEQLEERLQAAVAEERQRLLDQGLSEAAVAERLRTFQAEKRAELEAEFAAFRRQTEEAAAAREAALAGLVSDYEQSLQTAQAERSELEDRLQQREAELEKQFEARTEALESDRARVAEQLSRLQEQQSQEQLVRDQILGAYQSVNESIAQGEYAVALQQLESIRTYLDQEPARSLAGIQRRRAVELFIISSLEDLIRSRSARDKQDTQSLIESGSRIEALNQGVGRANQLLEQGEGEAAQAQYLSALGEIPSARTAYDQLSVLEARRLSQSQARADQQVASRLSQGRSLFEDSQYEESLERYREALILLLDDPAAAGRIVDQLGEIGARLAAPDTATALVTTPTQTEPEVQTEAVAQPDEQLLEQLRQARDRIAELEQENSRLTDQLARLESQQQLLQGDQAEVAAQLEQLEQENSRLTERLGTLESREQTLQDANDKLAADLNRLQAREQSLEQENSRLTDQIARLDSQQQLLQGDQAEVAAQIQQLEAEKTSLAAATERLQEEKASLTTAAEQLRTEKQNLSAQLAELQDQNQDLTDERDRLAEAQKKAQEAEAAREELRGRLAALESRYQNQRQSAGLSGITPPETLADLLEAKLLTWQIIGSDAVADQYPELYDTMDRYLETLTEQSMLQGRYAAVEDMITVVDAVLNGGGTAQVPADLWRRYSYTDQEDLLTRLLDKLEQVIK